MPRQGDVVHAGGTSAWNAGGSGVVSVLAELGAQADFCALGDGPAGHAADAVRCVPGPDFGILTAASLAGIGSGAAVPGLDRLVDAHPVSEDGAGRSGGA